MFGEIFLQKESQRTHLRIRKINLYFCYVELGTNLNKFEQVLLCYIRMKDKYETSMTLFWFRLIHGRRVILFHCLTEKELSLVLYYHLVPPFVNFYLENPYLLRKCVNWQKQHEFLNKLQRAMQGGFYDKHNNTIKQADRKFSHNFLHDQTLVVVPSLFRRLPYSKEIISLAFLKMQKLYKLKRVSATNSINYQYLE